MRHHLLSRDCTIDEAKKIFSDKRGMRVKRMISIYREKEKV